MPPSTPAVLILCTGNSARSQMAEGLLRARSEGRWRVESAGRRPSAVHPLAIRAMAELGIDLSGHRSKHFEELLSTPFDYVITVCDHAAEGCPLFPGPARRLHWSLPDPAAATGDEAQRLAAFRRVRDDLAARIDGFLRAPGGEQQAAGDPGAAGRRYAAPAGSAGEAEPTRPGPGPR